MTHSPAQPRLIDQPTHIRDLMNELAFTERRIDEVSSALVEMPCTISSAPRSYVTARLALMTCLADLRGAAASAAEELGRAQGEHDERLSEGGR